MEKIKLVITRERWPFGYTIKGLRKSIGLTQEEFALKIGVSRPVVGAWEEGRNLPTLQKFYELSKLFNVSMEYLWTDTTYIPKEYKIISEK